MIKTLLLKRLIKIICISLILYTTFYGMIFPIETSAAEKSASVGLQDLLNSVIITAEGPDSVDIGQNFFVDVGFSSVYEILDAEIEISYNENLVEYIGYTHIEGSLKIVGSNLSIPGEKQFVLAGEGSEGAITEEIPLIRLTFKAKDTLGLCEINVSKVEFAAVGGENGILVLPSLAGITVEIVPIPGDINDDGAEPEDEPTPTATPTSTITPPPGYTANVYGDDGNLLENTPVRFSVETSTAVVDLEELADGIFSGEGISAIHIPSIPGVNAYTLGISADGLSGNLGEGKLEFCTEIGSVTIPSNMLAGIPEAQGKEIGITISNGDKSRLPDNLKEIIGERPLVQLTLTLDGTQFQWENPQAPVTISIPYTPTAEELVDPEHIVVWYIDGEGNVTPIPNGRYNSETGMVTFTTTHFSYYAIAYVHKTFGDLESVIWAQKSIEVLASKGIIAGTGGNAYSPDLNITRADYLLLLVRTFGLWAQVQENFNDIEPDAYYYEAVGIARELGITMGVGNNRFLPNEHITRQDMMVLTARALEKFKGLKSANAIVLEKFTDRGDIAGYAIENLATMVAEGLILGSGGRMNPGSWATRAEAAVFLHRIYSKYP